MKKILALAFAAVTAFGAAAAGSAEARGRYGDNNRDHRYEDRYDRGRDDHRWNNRIGGSWDRSCTDSYVRRGVLYADCRTRNGKWRQTALRIDNCRSAENSNGRLVCTQWRRR